MPEVARGSERLSDRTRLRALAAIQAGPAGVLPVLAVVALLVGAAGLLILVSGTAPGAHPRSNEAAKWGLVALIAAALAGLVARRHIARRAPRDWITAAMLAGAVLLPLLLVPIHFMAARTHPPALHWLSYGFLDKRWLTSLFLLATLGSAVLLVLAARVVSRAHADPRSWREWLLPDAGVQPVDEPRPRGRTWAITALKVALAVLIAGYFFAPPWNLPPRPLDYHEALTMGGVQAIKNGSLPYIDSAAVQYGPLAQLANYGYAQATGSFTVDAFREVSLLFNWLAAALFLGALFLRVRPLAAAVTALAAFTVFPLFQMFSVTDAGFMRGFWGWGNPLRYVGVFVLALAFPAAVEHMRGLRPRLGPVALGAGWGLLCLVAQENLIGGALVLGVLSLMLVATDSARWRSVLGALGGIAAGFLLVVVPFCVYYAAHGKLGRFLELYLLVPQAVAAGYSNSHFDNAAWANLFYALPVILLVLLLASLIELRPLRIATRWTRARVVLVGALLAAVISHLGALTRSDAPHLKNTELALPAAICLAAFLLPPLLGARTPRWRWIGALVVLVPVLALLPMDARSFEPAKIPAKLWRPLTSRLDPPARNPRPAGVPTGSIAAARIGPATFRRGDCCTKNPIPMGQFARFMDQLHATVGGRRVLIESTTHVTPPVSYFIADLRPAPFEQDYGTMVLNTDIRNDWFAYFRAHLGEIRAVVTRNPGRRVPRSWAKAFPRHRTVVLRFGTHRVYVLLR